MLMLKLANAPAIGLAGLFAVGAVLSWPVIKTEWQASAFEASTLEDLGGAPPMPWSDLEGPFACDATCSPRAEAALGVKLAHQAAMSVQPRPRLQNAADAETHLSRALAKRPSAGEWWAWLAYARLLNGDDDGPVGAALSKSYDKAPFLAHLAAWRIGASTRLWGTLTAAVQSKVANEMVWLRDVDPAGAQATMSQVADPVAAQALRTALKSLPAPSVPHRSGGGPSGVGLVR